MATRAPAFRDTVKRGAARTGELLSGVLLGVLALLCALILASYHQSDPAINTAAGGPARNLLGTAGAWIADGALSTFGPAIALMIPLLLVAALRLWRGVPVTGWARRSVGALSGIILIDIGLALFRGGAVTGLPAGFGGIAGIIGADCINWAAAFIPQATAQIWAVRAAIAIFTVGGTILWAKSLGVDADDRDWLFGRYQRKGALDTDDGDAIGITPLARLYVRPILPRARLLRHRKPNRAQSLRIEQAQRHAPPNHRRSNSLRSISRIAMFCPRLICSAQRRHLRAM